MSTQNPDCPVREQLKRQALDLLDAAGGWVGLPALEQQLGRPPGDDLLDRALTQLVRTGEVRHRKSPGWSRLADGRLQYHRRDEFTTTGGCGKW